MMNTVFEWFNQLTAMEWGMILAALSLSWSVNEVSQAQKRTVEAQERMVEILREINSKLTYVMTYTESTAHSTDVLAKQARGDYRV